MENDEIEYEQSIDTFNGTKNIEKFIKNVILQI